MLFDTKNSLASIKISESEALIKSMYFYCLHDFDRFLLLIQAIHYEIDA